MKKEFSSKGCAGLAKSTAHEPRTLGETNDQIDKNNTLDKSLY